MDAATVIFGDGATAGVASVVRLDLCVLSVGSEGEARAWVEFASARDVRAVCQDRRVDGFAFAMPASARPVVEEWLSQRSTEA